MCWRRSSCFSARLPSERCRPTFFPRSTSRSSPSSGNIPGSARRKWSSASPPTASIRISSNVNGIQDIEAQTLNGISVQKIFFQPDVNLDLAIAQIVSATNAIRALMPPGIQPPIIVQYNASSVPVLQLSLTSDTLNEQQLYDYGIYRLRQQLAPIHGVTLPTPAGGKYRQIMVDIDPAKLLARGLDPARRGQRGQCAEPDVAVGPRRRSATRNTRCAPTRCRRRSHDLNNIPVKFSQRRHRLHARTSARSATARRCSRTSCARTVSARCCSASSRTATRLRSMWSMRSSRRCRPSAQRRRPACKINELFDQSVFVKARSQDVLREGAIAAGLTALMILLFLGSWRSTLVVMISIPLAILSSLVVLYFLGETINTMTLGGLALAVGILVDDSTVTIENTHRLLDRGAACRCRRRRCTAPPKSRCRRWFRRWRSAACSFRSCSSTGRQNICSRRSGLAVVFAMLASYGFSRTLTPITIGLLLKGERHGAGALRRAGSRALFRRFERGFERMRAWLCRSCCTTLLDAPPDRSRRRRARARRLGGTMFMFVGRDFFPLIDGGQIQLHVRAPAGTRIERTEPIFQAVEDKIREVIPEKERELDRRQYRLAGSAPTIWHSPTASTIGVNDGVDPGRAEGRPRADRRLHPQTAPGAARGLSRRTSSISRRPTW